MMMLKCASLEGKCQSLREKCEQLKTIQTYLAEKSFQDAKQR